MEVTVLAALVKSTSRAMLHSLLTSAVCNQYRRNATEGIDEQVSHTKSLRIVERLQRIWRVKIGEGVSVENKICYIRPNIEWTCGPQGIFHPPTHSLYNTTRF